MAIRKDLDDMLNNLKGNSLEKNAPETNQTKKTSIYDTMSVDDLLNALTVEKKPSLAENILNELDEKENANEVKEIAEDISESAAEQEIPEPPKKKKVVITGELPDYEELRRQEMEQREQERIRAENRRKHTDYIEPESEIMLEKDPESEPESVSEPQSEIIPETETSVFVESEISESDEAVQTVETELIKADSEEEIADKRKKKGIFSKRKKKRSGDDTVWEENGNGSEKSDKDFSVILNDIKSDEASDEKNAEQTSETDAGESASDLIEAALAAINGSSEELSAEEDISEPAENNETVSCFAYGESEESFDSEKDGVSGLIDNIRENAANAIAELEDHRKGIESNGNEESKTVSAEDIIPEQENQQNKGKITSALTRILDEDPETLIDVKSEKTESGEEKTVRKKKLKRRFYAVLGVIFTVFAVIGVITVSGKGIKMLKSFTSGEVKKDSFTELIYPVVIMDIESFDKPSDLTSEQIITASIWSIIMSDEKLEKYPVNIAGGDVISVSAYDIEAEAVSLFGEDHAEFVHTTVGPLNSRFYYDAEKGVYNVPIHPIVFTYEPKIKSIVKSGSKYTITVDYIDERPAWMEKSTAKSVEFHVTEKSDGTYQFESMKILYVSNNL